MSELKCPRCGVVVDEHPANRCLDAWVAETVMGKTLRDSTPWETWDEPPRTRAVVGPLGHGLPFSPSTSIADAWEVVEKTRRREWRFGLDYDEAGYAALFDESGLGYIVHGGADADTAPLAICRAALKAVLPEGPSEANLDTSPGGHGGEAS